jgi:hypothetical protein
MKDVTGVRIMVLVYPVDIYDREDAENIENNIYSIEELESVIPDDVQMFTLTDFMDACNNEDISLETSWIGYIREYMA